MAFVFVSSRCVIKNEQNRMEGKSSEKWNGFHYDSDFELLLY